MMWLYPYGDTFSIFNNIDILPERYHKDLIEISELPEGNGVLRRSEDGSFYYDTSTPVVPDPKPVEPTPQPVETTDQKLERVLQQLDIQRRHNENLTQQNLVLLDVNMTIYEELLLMQAGLSNA